MQDDSDVTFSMDAATPATPARRVYTLVFTGALGSAGRLGGLTPVDKDSFVETLSRARPQVTLALPPPVGAGADWELALTFGALAAFEAEGLLRQVPQAEARLTLWQRARERRAGRLSAADLDAAVAAAVAADGALQWLREGGAGGEQGARGAGPTDGSILDMIDEPDAARRVSADVERLAAEAGTPEARLSGAESRRLDQWADRLHAELTTIANALWQHPEVRRLEAAWRAVKLLVDRLDFRAGVRLALLDAPRGEVVARLNEHVVEAAFAGDVDTPGLVLLDFPFRNEPADIALLDELAQLGASLAVPLVFALEPAFFDVRSANLIKNLPNLSNLVDGWQFAKWRALRDQPYSRWLAAVMGRFLLRAPHARRPDSREFTCDEQCSAASQAMWAGGHLAMGLCAGHAFATYGWPTRMYGAQAGRVGDLPVIPNPADAQKPWGPGDLTLPDRRLDELPAVGINVLQSIPGTDGCVLLGGVTVARPQVTADIGAQQAALEISVPYQQFSNIAGAWLSERASELHGLPDDEIQKRLLFGLRDLLRLTAEDSSEAVMVGVGPAADDTTRRQVHVRITPPGRIVPGGLHVDFAFTVRS
jgi:type VI secretion system protein ImpC